MKKLTKGLLLSILALTLIFSVVASAALPGDADNPFLTQSFFDAYVNNTLIPYINQASTYTVVNVPQGAMLIGNAGCEIILRMGSATVIATEKGGLCDITIGGDWPTGAAVPANHNLIVPVGDGRGVKAETDIILMVKGTYTLY